MSGVVGWPEIFGHTRKGGEEFGHSIDYYQAGDKMHRSIFASDKDDHRRQRLLMAHAFSDAAIKEQEVLLKQYVDMLFNRLRENAAEQKPTDMVEWYNFTTFDIIRDLVYGEPFNCLATSDYHPWVKNIFGGLKARLQMVAFMRMPLLRWAQQLLVSKANIQMRIEHEQLSAEKLER